MTRPPFGPRFAAIRDRLAALDGENATRETTELYGLAILLTQLVEALETGTPDPDCRYCHGEGSFFEDVAGDGGSRMQQPCDCGWPAILPNEARS